jgi:hypothetical protein
LRAIEVKPALAGSGDSYDYRSPDGTTISFTDPSPGGDAGFCGSSTGSSCHLLPTSITSPDRKVVTIHYRFWSRCVAAPPPSMPDDEPQPDVCSHMPRIASVTNSFGFEVRFAYEAEPTDPSVTAVSFQKRMGASFYNNQAGSSPQAGVTYSYPSAGVTEITDTAGGSGG